MNSKSRYFRGSAKASKTMCKSVLFFMIIVCLEPVRSAQKIQVTTQNGMVRGLQSRTIDTRKKYFAFLGIPYAQPPVGDLRFQPPLPAKDWKGVYDATRERSICVQNYVPIRGDEDCLYINVYTPKIPSSKFEASLPVMFWIHGGGYIEGNGNYRLYSPDFLLNEDVVYASINYRLGPFGFLSTEDMVVPGNNGLKDQILALNWVQRNIAAFGGNPKNVTVFGESAGAFSVAYLLQSPLTIGLYQRGILQSGSSLCSFSRYKSARKDAFGTGKALGIFTNNSNILINGLRKVNYKKLQEVNGVVNGLMFSKNPIQDWKPAVVKEPRHKDAVVTDNSFTLLKDGNFNKVPILIGFNSEEVNYFAPGIVAVKPYIASYDKNVTRLVPNNMNIRNSGVEKEVGNLIKKHYVGTSGSFSLSVDRFIHFLSDHAMARPVRQHVKLVANKVPLYFYELTYEGRLGNPIRFGRKGVGHTEDMNYIFSTNTDYYNLRNNDKNTRYRMVRMWTNFAKFGNPTPEKDPLLENVRWDIASKTENLSYLEIGVHLKMRTDPHAKDLHFWDDLYIRYGRQPFDTY